MAQIESSIQAAQRRADVQYERAVAEASKEPVGLRTLMA